MLGHDVALAVAHYHVGNCLHAKRTLEVAVGVEQHVILPTVVVDERFHLVDVLSLVDRDGENLYACLLLPILINLAYG